MFKKLLVIIVMFQIFFSPLAYAAEVAMKDPWSAALKSAVLPGWGQYENGEMDKGRSVQITSVTALGLYLLSDQRVKQGELGAYTQDGKEMVAYFKEYAAAVFMTSYAANIADAYYSAENINNGNKLVKKDPMVALQGNLLFPGLGQLYVGDNVYDGLNTMMQGAYVANKALTGNSTERSWGAGFFAAYYIFGAINSYTSAVAHNEHIDKILKEQTNTSIIRPGINLMGDNIVMNFRCEY